VIEIDGRRAHGELHHFERDRHRQNRLVLAGYVVLRYTWHQLVTDPAGVAAQIRQSIEDQRTIRGK
jgi:very-short-patch-repair endonuclease